MRFTLCVILLAASTAMANPILATNPAIPPQLQLTTFATGLTFPYGMYQLPDGSLLVAGTTPGTTNLFQSTLQVVRITTTNGIANAPTAVLTGGSGPSTGIVGVGNVVVVATGAGSGSQILIMQAGPGGTLTQIGQMSFSYPIGTWWHNSHAIALQPVSGQPGSYQLLFSVGSQSNDVSTPSNVTVGLSGLVTQNIAADSLYSLQFSVNGSSVIAGAATQLASGLRNPFGLSFAPNGDIYVGDNGQDLDPGKNIPKSSDVFDIIPAGTSTVLNFGFANTYTDPTGAEIGNTTGVTLPITAFIPVNGQASQGLAGMALSPTGFTASLSNGAFFAFTGKSDAGGAANVLNPVIYLDLNTHQYFDFILGGQDGMGHLNSLLATNGALFLADFSSTGSFSDSGTGIIYEVSLIPEPATGVLIVSAGIVLIALRRHYQS
jgi:glucose/arabinose dehydrogenase